MLLPECTRIDLANEQRRAELLSSGWREIEVLETWGGAAVDPIARPSTPGDLFRCVEIAKTAFEYDRLHADERVLREDADRAKEKWVCDAFSDNSRLVFVRGKPADAFLVVKMDGSTMVVDLLAVHPSAQRKGFANDLFSFAVAFTGAEEVRAGTQAANSPARNFYSKLGLVIVKRERTFHRP